MAIPSAARLHVAPIGLSMGTLPKPIRWEEVFGNRYPVELEIGFGKGNFLTARAKAHPERNFFGIEWAAPLWRYTSDRLRRNGCLNARTVRAEAGALFRDFVPNASLAIVHLYFPDPWPKRRHHKRRLVQEPFLRELARCLVSDGEFRFATDHRPYFEQVEALIEGAADFQRTPFRPFEQAGEGEQVGSNFEKTFRRQGTPTFALTAKRR